MMRLFMAFSPCFFSEGRLTYCRTQLKQFEAVKAVAPSAPYRSLGEALNVSLQPQREKRVMHGAYLRFAAYGLPPPSNVRLGFQTYRLRYKNFLRSR
jgi:hypothetical protein